MRKKIGFFISSLGIGGIEKALLSMISVMDKEKYDITIYTIEKTGTLLEEFEEKVKVKQIPQLKEKLLWDGKKYLKDLLKEKRYIEYVKVFFQIIYCKVMNKDRNKLAMNADLFQEKLDIAVAYQVPVSPVTVFVAEKVQADKKYLWNHADIASVPKKIIKQYEQYLEKYDKIFSVSEKATQNVKMLIPRLEAKLDTFYNIINEEEIKKKAEEPYNKCFSENEINIVTVARLAKGKGYDLAIKITAELIKEGYKIKWYAVGGGEEKESLIQLVKQEGIEENFILLGEQKNPYPYVKDADIYVQPSEYEGYSITSSEAKILCKPIITTNTAGAEEKFKNEETAIIVEYDKNEIKQAIEKLINNKAKRQLLVNNLINEKNIKKNEEMIDKQFYL